MRINMTDKTLDALQALAISLIPKKEEPVSVSGESAVLTEEQKRAARVKALIKAHYPPNQSSHSKAISHIAAAIMGVDVKETLVEDTSNNGNVIVKKGTALMVTENNMGHSYPIGIVIFVYEDDEGDYTSCIGRHLYRNIETFETGDSIGLPGARGDYNKNSRYATEAEIIEEIAKIRALTNKPAGIGF